MPDYQRHCPAFTLMECDLPGAINVARADGHAEQVRLERLWNLYWSRTWVVPARRPGK